jgi:hypothetical protein
MYYAQAIVYAASSTASKHEWTLLARSFSDDGVMGALEALWNFLQGTFPGHMKRKYNLARFKSYY